jgi:hypothetical protein
MAEMTEFCPFLTYDTNQQKLFFYQITEVQPTSWVLQDNAGLFSVMVDQQFNAFFSLDNLQDAEAKPA